MDCKEAQREIQFFVREEPNKKMIKKLMKHIEQCPECQEELSIQYLIEKGLERLEEGNSFDLRRELENKVEAARRKIRRNEMIKKGIIFFGAMILLCVSLFLLIQVIFA